ncbi:MAG: Na+/H+ antiporter NhaA [Actinomycetota bacterium]
MSESDGPISRTFARTRDWAEARRIADLLRTETAGGFLLLTAATAALLWANSPWRDSYTELRGITFGPAQLNLNLDLQHWAADGLLAIFFFVAGLELKRELVVGDLRDPKKAILPVIAAVSGVLIPTLMFLAVTSGEPQATRGWAIPAATDIAFALAALAVIGSHLPSALRAFLLTLAVVDDLIAITIIAFFYSDDFAILPLVVALMVIVGFGLVIRQRQPAWWLAVPLAIVAWGFVHESGIHATVAGVLLAATVPVRPGARGGSSLGDRIEHRVRPISAGVAVPIFAFLASGVTLVGGGLSDAVRDRAAIGVVLGLVIGKAVGVLAGTWLTVRFTRAELDDDLVWPDVVGVSLLAGIGFTVSLLIGDLAYGDSDRGNNVKTAILAGSLIAATLAAIILRRRERHYRQIAEAEARDDDEDGVPDCYQQ